MSDLIQKYIANDLDVYKRLDTFLVELNTDYSRSHYSDLIKKGNILVNGKTIQKPGYRICENDELTVNIPEPESLTVEAENIPIEILYEDSDVIVVNKPKGMVVHPAEGHYNGTLVNALLWHCKDSLSGINGVLRPGIVHRIDMNTTGSLIVCKNDNSHRKIAEQIKNHTVNRIYVGIVHGNLKEEEGTINAPIGRSKNDRKKMAISLEGKEAITHYKVLKRLNGYTYVEFKLETGRTHQIRVHMASIHHPLLGDDVYGPSKCPIKGLDGQCLHAWKIGFVHPSSEKYLEYEAPIPEYMRELLTKLEL